MLELRKLIKRYHNQTILGPIELSLTAGLFLGLLGPNGSGKSTLLRLIVGTTKPSSGKILWNSQPLSESSLFDIAYLPDSNPFPIWMKVQDVFYFYSIFFPDFDRKECSEYLELFELPQKQKIVHLSKGNLAKLKLIVTICRKAKLYLLDEPLEGLDISSRKKMQHLLAKLLTNKCSIILSSHYVREMDQLFTDILILKKGEVILQGDKDTIQTEQNLSIEEIYEEVFEEVKADAFSDPL
jgi:ABC-2 type transport system ATP-binding protein